MNIESVKELLELIYEEIKIINERKDLRSIPYSSDFFDKLVSKFDLITFNIPTLIKILINARMIFSIPIVLEDRKNKVLSIEGYVISKGDIIASLKKIYSEELVTLYAVEFNKKFPEEKAMEAMSNQLDVFNNKPLGIIASISIHLSQIEKVLQWDIMKYSQKNQEKILEQELASCQPLSFFIVEKKLPEKKMRPDDRKSVRKGADSPDYEKFLKYAGENPIEKTLSLYGIEFYTRVCFRDYNFSLIQKHIESSLIRKEDDLLKVKKLLQNERANSDKDIKLQGYAKEINNLERIINEKLKKFD